MKKLTWTKFTKPKDVLELPDADNHRLYILETNFPIKKEMVNVYGMDDILGIEFHEPLSPYRILICIGNLFDVEQVKYEIEATLLGDGEVLKEIRERLSAYSSWAIYILPNSECIYATSEDANFKEKAALFEECKQRDGGRIIKSK